MLGIGGDRNYPTVLLIDDDLISREVIATILTLNGYTLHTAASGDAAVQMLQNGTCTPQVDPGRCADAGPQWGTANRRVADTLPGRHYAISGSQLPKELESVVDGFLLKPFSPEALQKLLEESKPGTTASREQISEEPVVSAKILSQFRQMMPEPTVKEVYVAVVTDLKKRNAALEAAIAKHDATEVRRIGHTIKGGCGMAGARQAAKLGALLEAESDQLNNSAAIRIELKLAQENLERMLEVEFPT